jgi:hypothetical protein
MAGRDEGREAEAHQEELEQPVLACVIIDNEDPADNRTGLA